MSADVVIIPANTSAELAQGLVALLGEDESILIIITVGVERTPGSLLIIPGQPPQPNVSTEWVMAIERQADRRAKGKAERDPSVRPKWRVRAGGALDVNMSDSQVVERLQAVFQATYFDEGLEILASCVTAYRPFKGPAVLHG